MLNRKNNTIIYYLTASSLILVQILVIIHNAHIGKSFWYDEAYSIQIIKYSYTEILRITSLDVHPPLYYFMLKSFSQPFDNSIFSLRIFSGMGVIACLFIGLTEIQKLFGKRISLVLIALIVIMPVIQYLSMEIRMYSWAMFFVLGASIYAYKIYDKNTNSSYIGFIFFSIAGGYTHYYTLICIFVIYILLGFALLKNRKSLKNYLALCFMLFLLYSPWIPIFINHVKSIHSNFWATIPTPKEWLIFVYYFISPKEPSHFSNLFSVKIMSVALIVVLLLFGILFFKIFKIKKAEKTQIANYFIFIYALSLAISLAITYLIKPISIPRCTTCMLGPLLVGLAIYVTELYKTGNKNLIYILFVSISLLSISRFFSEKSYNKILNEEKSEVMEFIGTDTSVVVSDINTYPEIAKLSVICTLESYYIKSDQLDFKPFCINSINTDINFDAFYMVTTDFEALQIKSPYKMKKVLKQREKTIVLIEKEK